MISRRLLRVKVLQILYAYYTAEIQDINKSEKELQHSINKSYELYNLLLLLITDISKYAESRMEIALKKIQPTREDLNPNRRFVENKIIGQLNENTQLLRYLNSTGTSWSQHPELIRELFNEILASETYKDYMLQESVNYEDDKRIITHIYTHIIQVNEHLNQVLEEMSIYWNDDLEFIISMIIKTIKKYNEADSPDKALMTLFKNQDDNDFVIALFRKTLVHREFAVGLIKQTASNWDIERIAFMDILIMQLAITELLEFQSIPTKVTLNEYLDVAKYYSTEKSNTFINGILDKILEYLKMNNKIQKTGRGLVGEN
jgi:transcription antitermination protein NusB